jgi:hypothetical protein
MVQVPRHLRDVTGTQPCLYHTNNRELFSIPLTEMLTHPWQSLQTWVATAQTTVSTCLKAYTERLLAQQPSIHSIFQHNSLSNNFTDTNFSSNNSITNHNTHGQESLSPSRR